MLPGGGQIEPLVFAHIVGRILAAMDAAITQTEQQSVHPLRIIGIGQEIDVARGTHDIVCGQGQSADQRRGRAQAGKGCDRFADLVDETRHAYMFRRYSPPTS